MLEDVQRRGTKMMRWMELLSCVSNEWVGHLKYHHQMYLQEMILLKFYEM